ncbi:MAG: heme-binding domain-containing protein [Opitutae bacterium]|nr:heme-binding domain-containing protein [Opitutae bacterium]
MPANVQTILDRACMDCHSNHTRYPWYAEVQPVRWWLDLDIADGKRHLNFSDYGAYSVKRATKKAEEIGSEVREHEMPPMTYSWMHPGARLTPEEIRLLSDWSARLRDELGAPKP